MTTGTKIAIGVGVAAVVVGGVLLYRRSSRPAAAAVAVAAPAPKPKPASTADKISGWAGLAVGLASQAHSAGLW